MQVITDILTLLSSPAAFPFTVLLGVCGVYWVVTLVAGLDLGAESVDGAVDGTLDGAVDGALDGAADGALDAAAGGADGAAEGVADAGAGSVGLLSALPTLLRLGRVPFTAWISVFAAGSFAAACIGATLTQRQVIPPVAVAVPVIWALSLVAGVITARVATRPLEPLFQVHQGRTRRSLVGEVAVIVTGRVDARFGEGRVSLSGDVLVIQVRSDRPDNGLQRNSEALIVDYDDRRQAFVVEPLGQARNHNQDGGRT